MARTPPSRVTIHGKAQVQVMTLQPVVVIDAGALHIYEFETTAGPIEAPPPMLEGWESKAVRHWSRPLEAIEGLTVSRCGRVLGIEVEGDEARQVALGSDVACQDLIREITRQQPALGAVAPRLRVSDVAWPLTFSWIEALCGGMLLAVAEGPGKARAFFIFGSIVLFGLLWTLRRVKQARRVLEYRRSA